MTREKVQEPVPRIPDPPAGKDVGSVFEPPGSTGIVFIQLQGDIRVGLVRVNVQIFRFHSGKIKQGKIHCLHEKKGLEYILFDSMFPAEPVDPVKRDSAVFKHGIEIFLHPAEKLFKGFFHSDPVSCRKCIHQKTNQVLLLHAVPAGPGKPGDLVAFSGDLEQKDLEHGEKNGKGGCPVKSGNFADPLIQVFFKNNRMNRCGISGRVLGQRRRKILEIVSEKGLGVFPKRLCFLDRGEDIIVKCEFRVREIDGFFFEKSGVRAVELMDENSCGPAVKDDMVKGEAEDALVFFDGQDCCPERRARLQVEGPVDLV